MQPIQLFLSKINQFGLGKSIHMHKFVLIISYFCLMLLLSFISEGECVYAIEEQSKQENISKVYLKNSESCTERCHVNYMAYENKLKCLT